MIKINHKSYILGIWFSSHPITKDNWMGCVMKDPENDQTYNLDHRFYNAKDESKSWTNVSFKLKDEQKPKWEEIIFNHLEEIQNRIEKGYPDKDKLIVQGNATKFLSLSKEKGSMKYLTKSLIILIIRPNMISP